MNWRAFDLMSSNVEPLYYGDMRLDNLLLALEDRIYETAEGHEIPVVTFIGILERVKWRLMQAMDD